MSQDIYEHNLRLLLTRSWQPLRPERGYVQRLKADLEAHMRRCHAPHVAAAARFGTRTFAAAAALVAAALLLWLRPWMPASGPTTLGPDVILARGEIALCSPAQGGTWTALAEGDHHLLGEVQERLLLPAAAVLVLDRAPDGPQASLSAGAWATVQAKERLVLQLDRGQVRLHGGQLPVELRTQATQLLAQAAVLTFRLEPTESGPERVTILVASGAVQLDGGIHLAPAAAPYLLIDGRLVDDPNVAVSTPPRTVPRIDVAANEPDTQPDPDRQNPTRAGLRVEVLDADHAPLGDYRVWARLQVGLPLVSMPDLREVSGDTSPWLWPELQPGLYTLVVEAHDHVPFLVTDVSLGAGIVTPLKVELERGRSLVGFAVDAVSGAPIQDVLVSLVDLLPQQVLHVEGAEWEHLPFGIARSDAAGRFEILNAPLVACDLRASAVGYAPIRVGPIRMHTAGPTVPQEIPSLQIERGAVVEGVVMDRDGNPKVAVEVVASKISLDGTTQRMDYGSAITDIDGHYLIEALPPGSYVVLLPGQVPVSGGPPIRYAQLTKQGHDTVDFPGTGASRLARGVRLRGRVFDATGQPIGGATVTLTPNPTGEWQTTNADPEGYVDLASVQPGRYELSVGAGSGYASLVFVQKLRIGLQPEQSFEVRMGPCDVAGKSLGTTGGFVLIQREDGRRWKFVGLAQVNFRGEWSLLGLPTGRMRALVFGKDAQEGYGMTEAFDAKAGSIRLADFKPQPTGSLEVTVLQENGELYPGVLVRMRNASGWELPSHNDPRTGPEGTRKLPIVPEGSWTLSIRTPDGRRAEREFFLSVAEHLELSIRLKAE